MDILVLQNNWNRSCILFHCLGTSHKSSWKISVTIRFTEVHFAENHFAEVISREFRRKNISPNVHFIEWTFRRILFPESSISSKDISSKIVLNNSFVFSAKCPLGEMALR
ncbi:unnamed protein product [Rhizophagus irregularis]|uniref:Uncharacterized protein n=1 Tax=Rhizophagus irregularis TaxID=588596 RepID=A0A916DZ05_9GLOM|nr:unnamed protein product [Rhizophagus irregularis]CAB5322554.1 unnamed protein product [Rhizophagus irregularis]